MVQGRKRKAGAGMKPSKLRTIDTPVEPDWWTTVYYPVIVPQVHAKLDEVARKERERWDAEHGRKD